MNPLSTTRLTRRFQPERPALDAPAAPGLAHGRIHEFCGPARHTLAATIAGRTTGPVYWIRPAYAPMQLNPDGLVRFFAPGRLVLVSPQREADLLWAMEETLRAGCIPLVVAELTAPPPLTPVRRLNLAAEAGAPGAAAQDRPPPLGVLLTPEDGGAPGVETRWHLAHAHRHPDSEDWVLSRRRARMLPEATMPFTPG